jgi:Domain of unknown function (DUF5916)/Carbohydrate family 9 binding domain-like
MGRLITRITILFTLFFSIASILSAEIFQPVYHPKMNVSIIQGEIKIDGKLDDSGWKTAVLVKDFVENSPGDQVEPPVKTKAYITYSDSHIYVAFVCQDNPSSIRASMCERDNLGRDDNVGFFIDTYGDGTWAYFFNVNPYGIQADALWSKNGGEDSNYDLIWESMGRMTESGYQIELAIPFSSLRFPDDDKQVWKAEFWRNHQTEVRRQYSWAAYDRDEKCFPCNWGTLNGIENVSPGQGIEILPSIIGFQSGTLNDFSDPTSSWNNEDIDGDASLGIKYSINSDITAEISINPDFSQIESDATQIDVNSTFALFFPEKRPFFQEGSDLYNSFFNTIYTRSINNPQVTSKLTGRMGSTSIAYIAALDEHSPVIMPFEESSAFLVNGKSISNIFSAKQAMGDNSQIGLILTDRRYTDGGSGSVIGFDGDIRLTKSHYLQWSFNTTHTEEPDDTLLTTGLNDVFFDKGRHTAGFDDESFWGHAVLAATGYYSRKYTVDFTYIEKSPRFRADNGYEPANNQRTAIFLSNYRLYPNGKFLVSFSPALRVARTWNFAKTLKEEYVNLWFDAQLAGQTGIHPAITWGSENVAGIHFNDVYFLHCCAHSNFSDPLSIDMSVNYGHQIIRTLEVPTMGKELQLSFSASIKPIDQLRIEPNIRYYKSDILETNENVYEGYTMRTRFNFQATRELSFRFITQYNDFEKCWEFDPLVTYKLNPFTLIYAGSTHDILDYEDYKDTGWKQASQQFFIKVQYLIQM